MCSLAPVSLAISMSRAIWSSVAGSRPALESQTGRDLALVDLAVADQVLVLAVAHKDLAEHLAVVHAATEHARTLHAATVVGEGDAPWATISPISDMASPLRPRVMAPDG